MRNWFPNRSVWRRKIRERWRRTRRVVPEHWSRQHGWFDAQKREENRVMVLIERSVETPRSLSMAARSLAGPTSRRPCRRADLNRPQVDDVHYPRVSNRILKGASHEEVFRGGWNCRRWSCRSDVDLERKECRDIQIPCIAAKSLAEPPEASRPQEGLKTKAPKHPKVLGRAIRHAPHREAFIPDNDDDGAGGRSNDLTKTTTEPEEGLETCRRRRQSRRKV
jgi:hypothetical protein